MVQRLAEGEVYRVDPADPRAPSEEQWAATSPEERARVVAMLPAEVPVRRSATEVLALDLTVEGTRLRFLTGNASVLEADELIGKLGTMLDEMIQRKQEAEERTANEAARAEVAQEAARAASEAARAASEAARAASEAARARSLALEQQLLARDAELAAALAEIERLKRSR